MKAMKLSCWNQPSICEWENASRFWCTVTNNLLPSTSYPATVQMAGGSCKYVPLDLNSASNKWTLDMEKIEAAIGPKTKIILLNTPHNPTGVHACVL